MAGILNNKTRIIDTIITAEGRRQLNNGNFRPKFASFTDGQAFYESDAVSGSSDATDRIMFEPVSLPSDKIFLEYDDGGKLLGVSDPKIISVGTGIFERTVTPGEGERTGAVSGDRFAELVQTVVTGSLSSIKSHSMLSSYQSSEKNSYRFNASDNLLEFTINNNEPFADNPNKRIANVKTIETLLFDKRASHSEIFQFLPPIRDDGLPLGSYSDLNQKSITTFQELIDELGGLPDENSNNDIDKFDLSMFGPLEDSFVNAVRKNNSAYLGKPRKVVKFENTTQSNNIMGEMFQVDQGSNSPVKVMKLSVIDFGTFRDDNDLLRPEKHVFFVGRVYNGYGNIPTFVNMFTLIFD